MVLLNQIGLILEVLIYSLQHLLLLTHLKYEMLHTEGKDNNKIFYYRVSHDGVILGEGKGRSKKAAEQEAAKEALSKLAK